VCFCSAGAIAVVDEEEREEEGCEQDGREYNLEGVLGSLTLC
jgi:hypothetical protein